MTITELVEKATKMHERKDFGRIGIVYAGKMVYQK